ncbi:Membrane-bound lytic murein transglycosylase B precursor [hydrothermal vent metagenome]|uniref:Membrane-bound lytic murein transglycosylase B n=1 Tax=hydrothermal vent metagenome TaxID=652676 RepID=A0A1W1EF55_9ZZZZ
MKIFQLVLLIFFIFNSSLLAKDYTNKKEVQTFINEMVKQHNYSKTELNKLFSNVKYQKRALAIYAPALRPVVKPSKPTKVRKKQGSWDRYEGILLKESKVTKGVEYMRTHRSDLSRAYSVYGVEPEYITAIIGVESHYGDNRGKFPVLDTLTTLSFEKNRRQSFFKSELKEFLLMTRREKVNPRNVLGSYAGAIGLGQFMPSNYKTFVVDFNNDGKKQMNNHTDAIGSIANYFKRHNWKKHQPVATRVSYVGNRYREHRTGYKYKYHRSALKGIKPKEEFNYGGFVSLIKLSRLNYDELWYGTRNFYAITRYNHSDYYAMAIHQLAQRIKASYKKKYGEDIR